MKENNTQPRLDLIEEELQRYKRYGFSIESFIPTEEFENKLFAINYVKSCDEVFYDGEYEDGRPLEEEIRITKCTWTEGYSKGNFGATQEQVDSKAWSLFDEAMEINKNAANRFYIMRKIDEPIIIYWYGRDIGKKDIIWQFVDKFKDANVRDFYEAFHYLKDHPYFEGEFESSLGIAVLKLNPDTNSIDDDKRKNTLTQVWLECGGICHNHKELHCSRYCHDIYLDCGGNTFEEAIIKLAALVRIYHG